MKGGEENKKNKTKKSKVADRMYRNREGRVER